jgi:N-acetylmuramoyl-L-alanine amidase
VKKVSKILLITLTLLFCAATFSFINEYIKSGSAQKIDFTIASASLTGAVKPLAQTEKFNILIIPGHDVKDGGADYKNVYERDLVAEIGAKIANILGKEEGYNVIVARDKNNWNPTFSSYFTDKKQEIIDWKNKKQADDKNLMQSGQKKIVAEAALYSDVSQDVSLKLYGMNKWANENNMDLVLSLHFNDSIRPNMAGPGLLKGFDIFIPESQMKNSAGSKLIAKNIFTDLKKVQVSETNSLIEDQNLIAIGASETLDMPAIIVEYGYIYEKQLQTDADREKFISDVAQQTALGIEDYIKTLNK